MATVDVLVRVQDTYEFSVTNVMATIEILVPFIGVYCSPTTPAILDYFMSNVDNSTDIVNQVIQDYPELYTDGINVKIGVFDGRAFFHHTELN